MGDVTRHRAISMCWARSSTRRKRAATGYVFRLHDDPGDMYSDCTMIRAEIEANNQEATELAKEQGIETTQNVAAGLAGVVIWPIWFGMNFKGAAEKDAAALQARQQYLTTLATERCAPGYRPPPPRGVYAPPQAYAPSPPPRQ